MKEDHVIVYAIKRVNPSNPRLKEWKMVQVDENHPYLDLQKFDFKKDAVEAAKEWASDGKYEIIEIEVHQSIMDAAKTPLSVSPSTPIVAPDGTQLS